MDAALVKFSNESAPAVVSVAIVGVRARPITITTNAAMITLPVTVPCPLGIVTNGGIDRQEYKINLFI